MTKHLLGFYRKNKSITSLYSSTKEYFDFNLKKTYVAETVPLKVYNNSNSWQFSEYKDALDSTTESILDKHNVWMTSQSEDSIFFALMYTDLEMPEMSRTGYLLVKLNNKLCPVISSIDGYEYVLEIKGLGSPEGGFPYTHPRRQAGCYDKSHIRITGGLFEAEAYNEFDYLVQKDKLFLKKGIGSHIKPLAVTRFKFLEFELGVLLRLVPSSFRASFMQHPELDDLLKTRFNKGYYWMGQCVAGLLMAKNALKHQNLSLNNMVYVDENTYDLTDFSEVQSLYSFPEMLDYITCIYPIDYFDYRIKLVHLNFFLKGLNTAFNSRYHKFKTFSQASNIHKKLLASYGTGFYTYVNENGLDFSGIKQNFYYLKAYLPKVYFSYSSSEWLSEFLVVSFKKKLEILEYLFNIRGNVPDSIVEDLLEFKFTDQTKIYLDPLAVKFPFIKKFKQKRKNITLLANQVNRLMSIYNEIGDEFLKSLSCFERHSSNISMLKNVLTHLTSTHFLNDLSVNSLEKFLNFKLRPVPEDEVNVVYPFLNLMYSFLYTQIILLESSKLNSNIIEKNHINMVIDYYWSIIDTCENNPEKIKVYFCYDLPDKLLEVLKWPEI